MAQKYIAGCGEVHSFTYKAYTQTAYAESHTYKSYESFNDVTKALNSGEVDLAIIPVYNTTIGDVTPALTALEPYTFKEVLERRLPIKHAVIAHPNTSLEKIGTVLSYTVALEQCKMNINRQGWHIKEHPDTAGAILDVLDKGYENIAAIGPLEAVTDKEACILFTEFNDDKNNTTVFKVFKNK